jgi:hypothetical protein
VLVDYFVSRPHLGRPPPEWYISPVERARPCLALDRGLYEVLITEAIDAQLSRLGEGLEAIRDDLRAPEAADRIALHLAHVVGRAIAAIDDSERTAVGIDLARRLTWPPRGPWRWVNCCAAS